MKPCFTLLVVAILLAGCRRDPDAEARKQIVGTWQLAGTYSSGTTFTSTITVGPGGNYTGQIVTHSRSDSERVTDLGGVFRIEHGILIDTMTSNSNTNAPLPVTTRAQIVRIDKHQIALRWETNQGVSYPNGEPVFRNVSR